MEEDLELARAAFARQAWRDAYALLSAADSLDAEDLERLAVAAYLLGNDDESTRAWERAHLTRARAHDGDQAARCAFWLGLTFLLRGEPAHAGGWLARAERLVEGADDECATRGLLLVPRFLGALESGDASTASSLADQLVEIGSRCDDDDVRAFGWLCRGEISIAQGDTAAGLKALDEVMVSVTTGELSPMCTGIMYCAVILACMEVFDIRRAAEWTDALTGWCAAQPDLVPFRGQCLVHRSQVLQAHGAWGEAVTEAEHARRRLSDPAHPALGVAYYQQGELHRLRGEFALSERAYRAAREHGREPAPGYALLRLATRDVEAAVAAIQRMVAESSGPAHAAMLAAAVEIFLALPDVEMARVTADELTRLAADVAAPLLDAIAAYSTGTVLLAEGDAPSALAGMRRARAQWHDLGMPYDAARARVQIALACRALGDDDTAEHELATARGVFERLGARPDLERVTPLTKADVAPPKSLTDRECEVLRLVAAGMTNREIASNLTISEHTVARHLQNIFMKLDLSSRAAATAYAYEHGVI